MKKLSVNSILFAAVLMMGVLQSFGQQPTVQTSYGIVLGNNNSGIYEFLGIPFASPPTGDLRWKQPVEPAAWTTPLSTQAYKPVCPQKLYEQGDTTYTLIGDEDCLYLNIWTPDTSASSLPVMVFIHGGGNQQGSASQEGLGTQIYNGRNLSERGNAVVITIQYRLGALGFLVHPGLENENTQGISGNYAIFDQILALQWIQQNAAAFGGDPSKVMIFGESAGGVNVGNLLLMPLAQNLFQRACIESAVPSLGIYETEKEKGIAFADAIIPSGSDSAKIAYLRSLPADSLVLQGGSPLSGGFVQMNWRPVADGTVFPGLPEEVIQSGNFNKVPLMIGSNADEMSVSAPVTVLPVMVEALINTYFPPSLRAQALALYPPGTTNAEARESYVQMLTDAQFTVPTRRTAQCISKNQLQPVFRYFFTHKQAGILQYYGAYHGLELFYVFNTYENSNYAIGPWYTPQDDSMQSTALSFWSSFADNGIPSAPALDSWPVYDPDTDSYLELKPTPDGTKTGLRTAKCDLWDATAQYTGCTSSLGEFEPENSRFSFYPNPAKSSIKLVIPEGTGAFSISVYDTEGRLLISDQNCFELSTSRLKPGLYFLSVQSAKSRYISKLIIQ
ncbi:MAG: carboxylesterase family protein [Bacteroidales bacterium]|nr:carboxylesterase family protein [Bacteroidales bacterium]